MSTPAGVDPDLITRICRDATTDNRNDTLTEEAEVVGDPLDGTAWVRMASWSHARAALTALNAYGISGHDGQNGRLHVTGWDIRLVHWRLGTLLAGVDDLTHEWDATAEMVCYHHDRRVDAGVDPDPVEVLTDVETAIRRCLPFPRQAPRIQDVDNLLELITAADDAYQQLIAEHVDYAEHVLAQHARPTHDAAPTPPGTGPDQLCLFRIGHRAGRRRCGWSWSTARLAVMSVAVLSWWDVYFWSCRLPGESA